MCVSGSPAALLSAASFTNMYIPHVGQEAAPSSHLVLNCVAALRAAAGFLAGCGASLVDAVFDSTLEVGTLVGYIRGVLHSDYSGCLVRLFEIDCPVFLTVTRT